jgi:hypothetical protein
MFRFHIHLSGIDREVSSVLQGALGSEEVSVWSASWMAAVAECSSSKVMRTMDMMGVGIHLYLPLVVVVVGTSWRRLPRSNVEFLLCHRLLRSPRTWLVLSFDNVSVLIIHGYPGLYPFSDRIVILYYTFSLVM